MGNFTLLLLLIAVIVNVHGFMIFKGDDKLKMSKSAAIYKFIIQENNHAPDPRTAIFGVYVADSIFEPQIKSDVGFNYSMVNYMKNKWMFYSESSFDYETQLRFYVFDLYVGSEYKTITIYIQNIDDEPPTLVCPDNLEMIDTISYDIHSSPCECLVSDPDGFLNTMTFSLGGEDGKDFVMGFPKVFLDVEQTAMVKIGNATALDASISSLKSFTIKAKDGAGHSTIPKAEVDVKIKITHA